MMNSDDPCHQHMLVSNECTIGGFISVEAKLAIVALRIPGEGSLLDMVISFDTTFPIAYKLSKIGCCMSHSAVLRWYQILLLQCMIDEWHYNFARLQQESFMSVLGYWMDRL